MLSHDIFCALIEKRYKTSLHLIPKDDDIQELFENISRSVNVDIYIQLLSYIDMWDFDNFQRYFLICLRQYFGDKYEFVDIESIRDNIDLQLLCLICMQHYFL